MTMKVKANGKVYEYDMKAIWIGKNIHTELKSISKDEEKTMGVLIRDMIKMYKKNR